MRENTCQTLKFVLGRWTDVVIDVALKLLFISALQWPLNDYSTPERNCQEN